MHKSIMPILLVGAVLMAEDASERPIGRVGLGTFTDNYSDTTGTRKGWILNGEWFRDDKGPWSFSAVGTQRPEGTGTQLTVGKEFGFGESSWIWAGLSTSAGADFLPRFRGDVDLNMGISDSWGLGMAGAWNRFSGGASTTMLQAGPSWLGKVWSASARIQQMRYLPGQSLETGFLTDLRWGAHNLERWHSLRIAWGQGVLDSLQPGGSTFTTSTIHGGRGRHSTGMIATLETSYPKSNELLVSTTSHFPITKRFSLRADLAWGQRETQFKMWSGSLQTLVRF